MALLLAMYQKMRLVREKNQTMLDQMKFTQKYDRVTKNIERQQKRFTSLFAKLDEKAKMMQSQATNIFQQMAGLSTGNYSNIYNPSGFTGINGFVAGTMTKYLAGGIPISKDKTITMDQAKYNIMMNHYMQNGGRFMPKTDDKGNIIYLDGDAKQQPDYGSEFNVDDVNAFTMAMRQAQNDQQNAQMWANQQNTNYQQNVSIWLEAAKAELEAEQDAVLEPLKYQETMWELEKDQADMKLKRIEAQLQTYNELVSKEAENSAPTFGLR